MPIDVKTLDTKGKAVSTKKNRPAQDQVLGFLKKNKDSAYMQSEIGAELDMRPQQARQILHALMKQKKLANRRRVSR